MGTIHCLNQHKAMKKAKAVLDAVGGTKEPYFELDADAMVEYLTIVHTNQNKEGDEHDAEED